VYRIGFSCRTASVITTSRDTVTSKGAQIVGRFICRLLHFLIAGMSVIALQAMPPRQTTGSATWTIPTLPCSTLSAPRVFTEVDERALTTIRGNLHPLAQPQYHRGSVSDSLPMEHMILMLQRSAEQEQALAERIEQMHDPHSPISTSGSRRSRFRNLRFKSLAG